MSTITFSNDGKKYDITLPNGGKGIMYFFFYHRFKHSKRVTAGIFVRTVTAGFFVDAMTTDIEPFVMSNPRIIMEMLMEQHTQRLPSLIALNRLV